MTERQTAPLVTYFLQHGFLQRAQELCRNEPASAYDPQFNFWRVVAIARQGSIHEAIRECEHLNGYKNFDNKFWWLEINN